MSKLLKTFIISISFLLIFPLSAFAGIIVTIDGNPLSSEDEPAFVAGKLMVPMRSIFEKLGANVLWNNGHITASMGDTEIKLKINDIKGELNNRPHILPVAPAMINGKTMVPLRFVSETLNADVDYLHEHQLVLITSAKYKGASSGSDLELKKSAEKYNNFKNQTMTNEKTIANFKSIKETILKDYNDLQGYEKQIAPCVSSKDIKAIEYAEKNLQNLNNLSVRVNKNIDTLTKDALTNKLGTNLKSYGNYIVYIYKLLADEKKINSLVEEKLTNAITARNEVEISLSEIEKKINDDIAKGRSGSIR